MGDPEPGLAKMAWIYIGGLEPDLERRGVFDIFEWPRARFGQGWG